MDQPDEEGGNHPVGDDGTRQDEDLAANPLDKAFLLVLQGCGDHGVGKARDRHGQSGPGVTGQAVKDTEGGEDSTKHDHGGHRRVAGFHRRQVEDGRIKVNKKLANDADEAAGKESPQSVGRVSGRRFHFLN